MRDVQFIFSQVLSSSVWCGGVHAFDDGQQPAKSAGLIGLITVLVDGDKVPKHPSKDVFVRGGIQVAAFKLDAILL